MGDHSYSVVMAAKDEEASIGGVLPKLCHTTDDLIVVDGRSTDRTLEIARCYGARIYQDNGLGKGDALRVGLRYVKHGITVFIDADGSHDPDDIPRLVGPLVNDNADLVMGSRMLGGSEELFTSLIEIVRLIGSLVIGLSINIKYGLRLTDYQNGFRAIKTEVARSINLRSNITTIEQEMTMKCLRYGYRVMEVPTHEYRRTGGTSKIKLRSVAHKYLWSLIAELVKPKKTARLRD
jgi:glycosyltransferase involved in cell wall biosynthesis